MKYFPLHYDSYHDSFFADIYLLSAIFLYNPNRRKE